MLSDDRDRLPINVEIPAGVDPDTLTFEVSISTDPDNPDNTAWWPATYSASAGVVLWDYGPGSDFGRLPSGRLEAFLRIGGLPDRLPVRHAGSFVVVGGDPAPAMPPVSIGMAELTLAMSEAAANLAAEATARIAGDAAQRPAWLPDGVAAATLDPLGTTLGNAALTSGLFYVSQSQWFGADGGIPTATRFIVDATGTNVSLFRMAVLDAAGAVQYVTTNEAAGVGSNGTKTLALSPVGPSKTFARGEILYIGWINVADAGVQIPRFAGLSAAVVNLSSSAARRRATSIAGLTDLPGDNTGAALASTVFFGQVLETV